MDLVDPDLVAVEVTPTFGPYKKYYLDAYDESCETTQGNSTCASGPRNAFHIFKPGARRPQAGARLVYRNHFCADVCVCVCVCVCPPPRR